MESLIAQNKSVAEPRARIFASLDVIHDIDRHGEMNMAIDEVLFHSALRPTLRFYDWTVPTVSIGYFLAIADFANVAQAMPIVRRWTGGGSVQHGTAADFTYCLVIPNASGLAARASYREVHTALATVINAAQTTAASLSRVKAPSTGPACFSNPVDDDIVIDDRKIAGAAQRRTRNGLLHQGSVHFNRSIFWPFASALALHVCERQLTRYELSQAESLAESKYNHRSWLNRI
jgi:lipoate-protein ligase A